jgi:hypothetical protein
MGRQLEEWGGEVRLPAWLRRALRRPQPVDDTLERRSERHRAQPPPWGAGEKTHTPLAAGDDPVRRGRLRGGPRGDEPPRFPYIG